MTPQEAANHAARLGYPFLCMDNDGVWNAFRNRPRRIRGCWESFCAFVQILTPIEYAGDWRDSLTKGEA